MNAADERQLRQTSRRLALQAGGLIVLCLLLVAMVQWALVERSAVSSARARLADATASLDRPEEAPRDVLMTIVDEAGEQSSVQLPEGFPVRDDLAEVERTGQPVERSVSITNHEYLVRTERVDGRIVQAALDRQPIEDESRRLIAGLAWAGVFGVLLAALAAAWLAKRAVAPMARTIALQRRFVADASHELRTPLTLLSTRAQMLARHAFRGDDIGSEIEGVVLDARNLGELLDELLVAADTRDEAPRENFDLAVMAADVVASAAAEADVLGVELAVDAAEPVHVAVSGAAVRRALLALVDNALDHASTSVLVRVTKAGRQAVIEVLDDGAGLRPDALPHVFDRFASRRDESSGPSQRRHYGLGLALVADVAANHGGRVTADNRNDGPGSRFVLELPLHR